MFIAGVCRLASGFKKSDGPQVFINTEFFFFHSVKLKPFILKSQLLLYFVNLVF
jgi:hypothetical protein